MRRHAYALDIWKPFPYLLGCKDHYGGDQMSDICYEIAALLCQILAPVPVGTNLGLFHQFWALLSGRLLTYLSEQEPPSRPPRTGTAAANRNGGAIPATYAHRVKDGAGSRRSGDLGRRF